MYSSSRSFSVSPRSSRHNPVHARDTEDDAERQQAQVGTLGGGREPLRIAVDDHLHHQHGGGDQQHARNRAEHGIDVLDHIIDPAAEIAGDDAEQDTATGSMTSVVTRPMISPVRTLFNTW